MSVCLPQGVKYECVSSSGCQVWVCVFLRVSSMSVCLLQGVKYECVSSSGCQE